MMEHIFKIGDTVQVLTPLKHEWYRNLTIHDYQGKKTFICGIMGHYYSIKADQYEGCTSGWLSKRFMPVRMVLIEKTLKW